jgi:hypothetical protein
MSQLWTKSRSELHKDMKSIWNSLLPVLDTLAPGFLNLSSSYLLRKTRYSPDET